MAINKKLIHFKTKAAFEAQLKGSNILDTSIVFIQDANLIWTHGTYYCLPSDEVVISNGVEPDNDQDLWIDTSYNTPITYVEEAPTDGNMYVRRDGAWTVPLNEVYVGGEEPTNEETVWIDLSKTYAEETLIINLASNQTNPDSNLNGVIINVRYLDKDHKQAWRGEALSFNIPSGTEYTIEYGDITDSGGNKMYTAPTSETHTAVGNETRTLSRYYNSEKLTVNVSGISSGFTITINGRKQTATSGTHYIPYNTSYTISASSVEGYTKRISESSIKANQQTRTVTVTYTKLVNGIYIYDKTGVLTAVESWDTTNNSSAIGVAVVSDNCAFVIEKKMSYSTKKWGRSGTTVSGIVTATDSSTALLDYAGNSNTTKIINQLGYNPSAAPTAFYCMTRTITAGGTTSSGYLGALGEWQTAYNNKSSIDSALSKIGGTAINTGIHWTSTQHSSTDAWCLTWGNGVVGGSTKDGSNYVRAFYPLS